MLLQAAQRGKAVGLGWIVEQVVAEDPNQIALWDEWGESQEHKTAFRTIATPMLSANGLQLSESRITTLEFHEILWVFCESSGNLDL